MRVITLGALLGLTLPAGILLLSVLLGGGSAMNFAALTPFVFALTLAYAVVKHDLFEIDAMVKRGAYYLLLTGAVGLAYLGCVLVLDVALTSGGVTQSAIFPVLFALAVLLLLNPLRTRLQTVIDRVFFRTGYDATRVLGAVGRELVSSLQHERIVAIVAADRRDDDPERADARVPGRAGRAAPRGGRRRGRAAGRSAPTCPSGASSPSTTRPRAIRTPQTQEAVRSELRALEADLAVPLEHGGDARGRAHDGPQALRPLLHRGRRRVPRAPWPTRRRSRSRTPARYEAHGRR